MGGIADFYPMIMAGGSGTRLWPWSRQHRPKQFLRFASPHTLLQQTYHRIAPLTTPEHTFIVTNHRFVQAVQEQLPTIPPQNILPEPEGRNTAPAIAWAAAIVHRFHNPRGVMAALSADNIVRDEAAFRQVMRAAIAAAREGHIVTLGIPPTHPETGYGYIERGHPIGTYEGLTAYQLRRFTEKPNRQTAEQFLKTGRYYWDGGMLVFRVDRLLEELARYMPELYAGVQRIAAAWHTPNAQQVLHETWPTLPNISIDYGLMEHLPEAAVIPAHIGWNDIGSWEAVYQELPKDPNGNATTGDTLLLHTQNTLALSEHRLIATFGVSDLIIVETPDAILICPRHLAQHVRDIVQALKNLQRNDML